MNHLTDYAGLFNCLRPDPPAGYGACDVQDEIEQPESCDFCKSYNDEKPKARFVMKDLIAGTVEVIDLCNDCINEDSVFMNKRIIDVVIL